MEGARVIAFGLTLGVTTALGLSRFLASELYGVTSRDTLAFAIIPLLLAVISLGAVYVPAEGLRSWMQRSRFGASSFRYETIPRGSRSRHAPRVKSGTSTGSERFATERSLKGAMADHAAAS